MNEPEAIRKALTKLVQNGNLYTDSSELLGVSDPIPFEHFLINSDLFSYRHQANNYHKSFKVKDSLYTKNVNDMYLKWNKNKIAELKNDVLHFLHRGHRLSGTWEFVVQSLSIEAEFSKPLLNLLIQEGFLTTTLTKSATFIQVQSKVASYMYSNDVLDTQPVTINTGSSITNNVNITDSNVSNSNISNSTTQPEKKNYWKEIIIAIIGAVIAAGIIFLLRWN